MLKSIGTAVAGIMFVLGFALVSNPKMIMDGKTQANRLKPSAEMVKTN